MTKQELEAQAAKLQAELDAMKSKIAQMDQPKGRWVPRDGDMYYTSAYGFVTQSQFGIDSFIEKGHLSIGNCFRTKEEAERHIEKLKVIEELKSLAGYWKPDWVNWNQRKYYIRYNSMEKTFHVDWMFNIQELNNVYFKSDAAAQNAINVLGDRLKVLL